MMEQIVAGMLIVASASSGAQPDVVWKWQPEEGVCALRQLLDDRGSFVQVSRTPGSDQTAVTLQDRNAKVRSWKPFGGAILKLEPEGTTTVEGSVGPGELPRSRTVAVEVRDQKFLDAFSRASALTLSHRIVGDVSAPVRDSAAAVQALRKCEDARMAEWGIDAVAWRTLQMRPIPVSSVGMWFTSGDYPRLAAIYGVGAFVVARLDVGPDGTVRECTVVNKQSRAEFGAATCGALRQNARFHPAIDAQGRPTVAPFVVQMRFQPNP